MLGVNSLTRSFASASRAQMTPRASATGIALVTFDFYGCGDTGGDFSQMTNARWKDNLSDIISWVQTQSFSNNEKIGCYAFSAGTAPALRLAAEDQRLAYVISVGTCISTHYSMRNGGPAKVMVDNLDKLLAGGTAKIFGYKLKLNFFTDAISNAPIHMMKKIKCPTLFLQGTADDVFRCADAKMAYDLIMTGTPHEKTAYIPLEDAVHTLDNKIDKAMETVFNWLKAAKR